MKKNMKNSVCFMAFAAGKESTEGNAPKLYKGVGSVYVLGVNPTKAELEKFFNREYENAPEYVGEQENNDGEKVATARVEFVIATDPAKNGGIEAMNRVSYFLRNEHRYNSDKTKVQVIDEYGRTAWVPVEMVKNHEIPVYKNGNPANITKNYRPAYVGEEDLIKFLIAYLNIPNPMKYINSTWEMVEHPEDSEAGLEKIASYFKGDFSELKSIIALQPKNKVKLCFGVRTTDDNKQYQSFYTQMPLKNNITDYSRLDKDIQERQSNASSSSALAHTEFGVEDLHEYTIEETTFEEPAATNSPESGFPW